MNVIKNLFNSSVGKKYIMALTGCAMFLFAVGHMVGNLQVFLGPEAINRYAHFLQSTKELLWPVRLGLLAIVGLHVWSGVRLTLENQAARPIPYASETPPVAASLASRTMLVTGLVFVAFILFHLAHYTVRSAAVNMAGVDFSTFKDDGGIDVYKMVIVGFQQPVVCLLYLAGVGLLCFHISHGIAAVFQSLGLRNHYYTPIIDQGAKVVAAILFLGYAFIPFAIWILGFGKDVVK